MFLLILLQVNPGEPGNWFQYGIAGVLAFLIFLLLKYVMQRDKADQDLAKQRSDMYRQDNSIRDQRFLEALKTLDVSGQRFIDATNNNIEKFIILVNKVMEQGNYQTQVLTELKSIVGKLPTEFQAIKTDINKHLEKLVIHYELKLKDGNGN